MKVAIYTRVSTHEQTTENQRLILVEYANKQGWDYDVFEEVQSSRKTRPVKQKVMAMLREGQYDGILILKLDRFARSLQELIFDATELTEKGLMFCSLRDNIDLSTATGRLQFNLLAAISQFERELIVERVNDGLARAKKQGKTLGRPKGSKDKKVRKKGGYYLRYMDK